MPENNPNGERMRSFMNPVIFSFLAAIAAMEFIRESLFFTLLPSFLTNLHYNTAVLGYIITANLLADNGFKSAAGWLVDRRGPWPVLIGGSLVVFTGIVMIMNFHHNFWLLMAAAILIGIGVSPTWPAAISGSIQTMGEEKRATMISIISVVWMGGGGLGPVLTGFLIDPKMRLWLHKYNLPMISAYRSSFMILLGIAIWAIVVAVLGLFNWRRVPHVQMALAEQANVPAWDRLKEAFSRLWRVKGLIPGMLIQTLALGMLVPNLLPYATQVLGLSEAQYSLLLLTGGAVVIAFMIPVGHLADRMGTRGFLVSGFLVAAGALFVMTRYGNAHNIWFIVAFVGLSYALIQPAWNALLAGAIPPEQRGVLMGLFMAVEGFGFAIGPAVGGALGSMSGRLGLLGRMGAGLPFYVSSFFLVLMAFVYLFYPFQQYRVETGYQR